MEKRKKADERAWIEQIIAETEADFAARQEERAALEKQWELNMQFLIGNQYAEVSSRAEIVERDRKDSTRAAAPLRRAEDAVLVDTTGKSLDESFAILLDAIRRKLEA